MNSSPLVLGLDVGTQSLRAALVDLEGRTVAFGVEPIDTTYPRPGWAEQDPRQWWKAAGLAVRAALNRGGVRPPSVVGIGLSCTACTVVACDLDAEPLRPALLWMDQRAAVEAADLSGTDDPNLRYVSGRLSPEWMLPKALWLKRHEPEVYARAGRIVECTNWFMRRLTGEWTLSLNHVAVKWNYARPEGGWPLKMMAATGLDDLLGKWPERIEPLGQGGATLTREAAADLGLEAGTPVAQGGIDAYLGMLGMGATGPGDVSITVGSSTCHLAQSKAGVFGSGAAGCYPDATVEGLYTLEAGQTATGSILDWYRRHFAGREQREAEARGVSVFEVLDAQAAAVPPGAEGLIVRDDWQGNRSPYKNPGARGAIVGLTLAHGPGHVIHAASYTGRPACRAPAHPGGRLEVRPGGRADLRRRGRGPLAALAPDPRRRPATPDPPDPRPRVVRPRGRHGRGRRRGALPRLRRRGPLDGRHRPRRRAGPLESGNLRRCIFAICETLPGLESTLTRILVVSQDRCPRPLRGPMTLTPALSQREREAEEFPPPGRGWPKAG